MLRMLIIADDLSGAADSAIACTHTGMSASVALNDQAGDHTVDILAIDSDTRHLEPHRAADRVVAILSNHAPNNELLIYKKLDSTLRGNVAAELTALLKARRTLSISGQHIIAVMAPAFPAGGRTTVKGQALVHGILMHQTETWRHAPSTCPTDLLSIFQTGGMRSTLLTLDHVRSGDASLRAAMAALSREADILVCDAETDEDLRAIASASMVLGTETIWAGSAGLAYHMPHAAGLSGTPTAIKPRRPAGPMLMVMGTMSGVSRRQVEVLLAQAPVTLVALSPRILLAGPNTEYAQTLSDLLQRGQDVIVVLETGDAIEHANGRLLSRALADLVAPHMHRVGAFVASGGETARAILEVWGVDRLQLIGELEPGLPLSLAEALPVPLPIVTKAGAFGNPQTLFHCWQFLNTLDRGPAPTKMELRGSR